MPDEGRLGSVARRLAATQRVLSIEDEQDIADFLRAYFRASGYDLVHVDPETPLEVLDAIDEHRPDCVLLDLGLRGFNGTEAYRLIRTEDRYAYLPVIVVSARPDAADVVAPGGLDAVVTKPFNVNTLADIVNDHVTRARALREAGEDERFGIPTAAYVEARLDGEVALAVEGNGAVSFGLLRITSLPDITTTVGDEGRDYVVRELLRSARSLLPSDAVLGLSRADEIAVVLPAHDVNDARIALDELIAALGETAQLPGGASVPVRFSSGIATYPDHAHDADGLYMASDAALADACDRGERIVTAV